MTKSEISKEVVGWSAKRTVLTSVWLRQLTSVPQEGQRLPGMTQTVCPLAKQLGHRRPGTCDSVNIEQCYKMSKRHGRAWFALATRSRKEAVAGSDRAAAILPVVVGCPVSADAHGAACCKTFVCSLVVFPTLTSRRRVCGNIGTGASGLRIEVVCAR